MNIQRLKDTIINRIAAGEVVERPASVVKELVENAIDAGADRIEIACLDGGKSLIRVLDNGGGIAADELELAVSRHCTSKLGDDIHDIRALGFRGEALPSIASVARLRLASRQKAAAAGAEITIDGGAAAKARPAALPCGTLAEVRDLFYATPARLKFLKSDKAEAAAISETVKRIAIAFPHIRFTLAGAGRIITDLPAAPLFAGAAEAEAYRPRLTDILGNEFMENSLMLKAQREGVDLFGFIGIPSYHRGNALHQFTYINGRPVRDKHLGSALRAAYADMLPNGRHAAAALFLRLDPALVDVNVHPAKADVRFRDPGLVRGLIIGAIRQRLEQAGARPAATAAAAFKRAAEANASARSSAAAYKTAAFPAPAAGHGAPHFYCSQAAGDSSFSASAAFPPAAPAAWKRRADGFAEDAPVKGAWPQPFSPSADFRLPESETDTAAESKTEANEMAALPPESPPPALFPLGAARAQIHQNYIIAQTEDSLIIVDQHAAHERLVYEALKQALYAEPLPSQILLIPEIIELPAEDIARLCAQAEVLQRFGLCLEPFGAHALMVRETPALLGQVDVQRLIRDLADEAAEHETVGGLKNRLDYIAATMACHGSVRSGRLLKPQEMNALLRQMEQVPQSGTCNHGRPTFIELKLTDIEKLFARR